MTDCGGKIGLEAVLHHAERMAAEASAMPSRTAMLDPLGGDVVPVEQAQLAARRPTPGGRGAKRRSLRG